MVKPPTASPIKASLEQAKSVLSLELDEIKEISELLFQKLEKKIQAVKAMESSLDKKIATLELLLQRTELLTVDSEQANRRQEIVALRQKGLDSKDIAGVLDMPRGEIDLILDLHAQKT